MKVFLTNPVAKRCRRYRDEIPFRTKKKNSREKEGRKLTTTTNIVNMYNFISSNISLNHDKYSFTSFKQRLTALGRWICTGNSMIWSDIWYTTTSNISKLLYVISRAVGRVNFEKNLKYQEWYFCQVSRTNHAIICLYYYPQRFCNFHILSLGHLCWMEP